MACKPEDKKSSWLTWRTVYSVAHCFQPQVMLSVCKAVSFRCDCLWRRLNRAVLCILFCWCLCWSFGSGAEKSDVAKAPAENQKLQQELKAIRAEIERLKEENGALKKQNQLLQSENQRLRRL